MQEKSIDFSKRHNSALFKYSNQEVFDRREKQFISDKIKKNLYHTIHCKSKNNTHIHHRNLKQKFLNNKNILNYLKTLIIFDSNEMQKDSLFETISFHNELELDKIKAKRKLKSIKKIHHKLKSIETKEEYNTNINNNNNIFSLTLTNDSIKNKRLYNNNSSKYYNTINHFFKTDKSDSNIIFRNKKNKENEKMSVINNYNYKDIKQLLIFKAEKERDDIENNRKTEYNEKLIDYKIKKYFPLKEGFKKHIEKLHQNYLIDFSTNVKKERSSHLEEVYNNQIEYYKETYSTLIDSKKLFEEKYLNKTVEYLKFLSIKIEKEKLINSNLLEEIMTLKNEIENINTRIIKAEYDKSNIIRWLFLQIQIKELKLVLPPYYRAVFEYNISNMERPFPIVPPVKKESNFVKRDFKMRPSKKYKVTFIENENVAENKVNKRENSQRSNIIDLNGTKINIEEFERIRKYKEDLIYPTVDKFNEAVINIENHNLKLIEYNDILRDQLILLKKEYNKLKDEENMLDSSLTNKIRYKEDELSLVKSIANKRINCGITANLKKYYLKEDKRAKSKSKNKQNKKPILHKKVLDIYKICKIFANNYFDESEEMKENKKKTIGEEIINMLKYIEFEVDELIKKVYSYHCSNDKMPIKKFIFKIKFEIEKEHRKEKAELQKLLIREKNKKLYEEIESRNQKIYFLPRKKIDISSQGNQKKKKIKIKSENEDRNELEEFLGENY